MLQGFRQLRAAALAPVLVKHPVCGEAQQGTNGWKHVTQHFIAIFLENEENDGNMMGTWCEDDEENWDHDGKMIGNTMGKWWEYDGKMMRTWWEHEQKLREPMGTVDIIYIYIYVHTYIIIYIHIIIPWWKHDGICGSMGEMKLKQILAYTCNILQPVKTDRSRGQNYVYMTMYQYYICMCTNLSGITLPWHPVASVTLGSGRMETPTNWEK